MSQKRNNKIKKILYQTVQDRMYISWAKIKKAVSTEMNIKNWLEVRGMLQWLINEGILARTINIETGTTDIHNENYLRLSTMKDC